MDERVIDVFLMELVSLGEAMRISVAQYNDAKKSHENDKVFLAAQSILTCGALVSKMLWMSQSQRPKGCSCPRDAAEQAKHNRAKERCKALRDAVGIKGAHVLENRKVRNGIEHFDDRVDEFFAEDPHANYFHRIYTEGPNAIVVEGGEPRYMRHIEGTTNTVTVLDDSMSLQEVADAVLDIAQKAQRASTTRRFA